MIVNETRHIGGEIVGLGIVRTDGTEDFRWLDKPIHNRITSAGLDHMLCYAGNAVGGLTDKGTGRPGFIPNLYTRDARYASQAPSRTGVLNFCKIGTSGSATEFNMTDLVSPVTTYSDSIKTGVPFTGTQVTSAYDYRIRITHVTTAVTTDCNIKEFGLFGSYTNGSETVYPMFCRIKLDNGVNLSAGEKLMVTYELHVVRNATPIHIDDFFGMIDADGNPLQCDILPYSSAAASTSFNGSIAKYAYLNTSGLDDFSQFAYFPEYTPYYYYTSTQYGDLDTLGYSTQPQQFGVADAALSKARTDSGVYEFGFTDYHGVGTNDKHRDVTVTMGAYNPNMTEPSDYQDIYFLRYRGLDIKFGYTDDEGVFIPQALRKWASQNMIFTFRTRYVTPDTIQADGSDPSEAGE